MFPEAVIGPKTFKPIPDPLKTNEPVICALQLWVPSHSPVTPVILLPSPAKLPVKLPVSFEPATVLFKVNEPDIP